MNGERLELCLWDLSASSSCHVFAKAPYSCWKPESPGQGFGGKGCVKGGRRIFQVTRHIKIFF